MKRHGPLVPMRDYERIFRVIDAVLASEGARPEVACTYFAIAGAALLTKYYNKKATPVAGSAFFRVDDPSSTVLAMSEIDGDEAKSSTKAFHFWVECDGYVLDFQAPLFREALTQRGSLLQLPRLMFQKPIEQMAAHFRDLRKEGEFFLVPNKALTLELYSDFSALDANRDIVEIISEWFQRPPKSIAPKIKIANQHGQIKDVPLRSISIAGAW